MSKTNASNHIPSPIQTLTVGSGFSPDPPNWVRGLSLRWPHRRSGITPCPEGPEAGIGYQRFIILFKLPRIISRAILSAITLPASSCRWQNHQQVLSLLPVPRHQTPRAIGHHWNPSLRLPATPRLPAAASEHPKD